ncbi:MAG: class I SAM-dependent methyltransferase, partial [Thaumarchaeota archaeon]|nr:class I SAM-dependent methyltransferase [Nitrososphaerota archaeon]
LAQQLKRLYEFGKINDSKTTIHSDRMLNITPETGIFLSIMIQSTRSKRVLEIGTSNGYSTLWMADALGSLGGMVTTVEVSSKKARMARDNFNESGLSDHIDLRVTDIREFLTSQDEECFDLVFLDAERPEYVSYWKEIDRVLKKNGLLIVDNAITPKPNELIDFFNLLERSERYLMLKLQMGNGEMLALKTP